MADFQGRTAQEKAVGLSTASYFMVMLFDYSLPAD